MARTVFLNGEFMPEDEAKVPIFDRGLLFADSVYEGFGILDSQIVDYEYHMNRFDNFSILLKRDQHMQLVYKHAISTIMPMAPIQLQELDDEEADVADDS